MSPSSFIRTFAGDPECVRTLDDIERLECIPIDERIPCRSTIGALRRSVELNAGAIALTFLPNGSADDPPQRWTYREYWGEIVAAANLFHELGLTDTSSVAVLLPNVPEMLFALWGAQARGIVAPINPFLSPEQIAAIAVAADACILVTLGPDRSSDLWAKAQQVRQLVPAIRHIVAIGGAEEGAIAWASATGRQRRDELTFERSLSGAEIAAYFHTGGTTGAPKLACRTHRAEVVNVGQMLLTTMHGGEDLDQDVVILCGLPLFHVSAYIAGALSSIMRGADLLLAGPAGFREQTLIRDFWRLVELYRVTFFSVVPTVYAALLDQSSAGHDISSLRLGGSGGSPLSMALLGAFRERTGADVIEGYGMTESTACATAHTLHGARRPGSVGMRLPYQQIRIVELDSDGRIRRDCATNEIGLILLSGPNVIPAYKQPAANEGAWPAPGWLNTGDLGRRDEDGYYWLTGRAKDLIIRGGHNLDPRITEEALMSHPDVLEAAAVGLPDAYAGELPLAYVRLRSGSSATPESLVEHARRTTAERAAAPVEVIVCEDLPKTAVGKIYKPALRKDAVARAYAQAIEKEVGCEAALVSVQDDSISGLVVVIEVSQIAHSDSGLRARLTRVLEGLVHRWEIIASP